MMDPEIAIAAEVHRRSLGEQSEPESKSAGSPVDMQHLSRYTLGDRALEEEILGLFADQLPKSMEALKRASTPKDWKIAAHTLKGSARAVGARRLAERAEFAENIDFPGDQVAYFEALNDLADATAEARSFVANLPNE